MHILSRRRGETAGAHENRVAAATCGLSSFEWQVVLYLTYAKRRSPKQIAAALETTEPEVKAIRTKALAAIRASGR